MTHDELLDRIAQEGLKPDGNVLNTRLVLALRAVVEWTNNLQDTESWQDDAEYNAGYNNAIYEVIEIINKELK